MAHTPVSQEMTSHTVRQSTIIVTLDMRYHQGMLQGHAKLTKHGLDNLSSVHVILIYLNLDGHKNIEML